MCFYRCHVQICAEETLNHGMYACGLACHLIKRIVECSETLVFDAELVAKIL